MPKKLSYKNLKFVKIGGHKYDLKAVKGLVTRFSIWGRCIHMDKEIDFDPDVRPTDFLATIIHEAYEAIKSQRELGDLDHRTLTNMEDGTVQLLVDNKELFMKILRAID